MSGETHRWVALARVLRPRGNKGEVAAELFTDFPERIAAMKEVFLSDSAGTAEPRLAGLQSFWMDRNHPGQGVFHFEGCASISEAERFRDMDVVIPFEQRVTLPAGKLTSALGVRTVTYQGGTKNLAIADEQLTRGLR